VSVSGLPAPAPGTTVETRYFWDETARGRLMLRRCRGCNSVIWYPRAICPECSSNDTEWFSASGRGRVYSYTVNHLGEGDYAGIQPYVLAYVELDEGPRILTNIVGADAQSASVGAPVCLVLVDTGQGSALPRFQLAADQARIDR
jgi:uncharacterized protein